MKCEIYNIKFKIYDLRFITKLLIGGCLLLVEKNK